MKYPNKHKICAHLKLEDGTTIDLPVKTRKLHDSKIRCIVTLKTNPLNSYITVCKNSFEELSIDAPKACQHPDCTCNELSVKFVV